MVKAGCPEEPALPVVPQATLDLVARFERQLDAYRSGQYNETQLRREFLDPLFKVLGWDIDNEQGYAEAYKDVIHEDAIRIGGAVKAPDYCFRIGGTRKFFLEAKKPSVCIKDEPTAAYQLRRYAWSAKLPLSILSDFEEFAVYDGRFKPHKDDPAAAARIFLCTFRDFAEKWEWIASIFSREAVLKGLFDRFAESSRAKRGTSEVDAAFLETIEGWRLELARNLALRNPKLTQRELNFAVQRIIDRIIFLRICEDRRIEDYGRLRALVNGDRIYPRLGQLFQAADARYNSGLFHFQREKGRHEDPDELTLALELDDALLRDILRSLYYPDSPYEFSVLSADILGQVYEQFLGKVIRLTEGHRAVVEDKPEVKKAGGVYYTPTYIVDYIVRQTVGKLLDGCSSRRKEAHSGENEDDRSLLTSAATGRPMEARAASGILSRVSKLRILDPACGSGSFLIGAYQSLLDWHLQFYLANDPVRWAKGGKPALVQTSQGWKLTIAERKRILLNNLFGVDIDTQAVEVTKLSLLLKVLEGETGQSLQTLFRFSQERALPDLGDNIKCGNSLIGPDFYQQAELPLLTDEERYRINVFDWSAEFSQVFRRRTPSGELRDTPASPLDYTMPGVPLHGSYSRKKKKGPKAVPPPMPREAEWEGGFDAVIGNPPYVRIQRISHAESDYLFRTYESPTSKMDLSLVFLEKGLHLANHTGRVGFICTSQWLSADYGQNLRRMLARGKLHQIVDFGSLPVFQNASTYPAIFLLSPKAVRTLTVKRIKSEEHLNLRDVEKAPTITFDLASLTDAPWNLGGLELTKILQRSRLTWKPLSEFGGAYIGCKTGMNEAFVLAGDEARKLRLEKPVLFPYALRGEEVRRYATVEPDAVVIYPYCDGGDGSPELIPEAELKRDCPRVHAHLVSFKDRLRQRQDSRRFYADGPEWYRHLRAGSFRYIRAAKLALKGIATRTSVGLLPSNTAFDGARCPSVILDERQGQDRHYFLGILNSSLATAHLKSVCSPKLNNYIEFSARALTNFPIRVIDFSNTADKSRHDRLVKLVEQMLALHGQAAAARTPQEQTALTRQIAATDTQIDRLVYDLYGLTEDEISIVEGAT